MATYVEIDIADLRLDVVNPRHPPEDGQREAIAALLRDGSAKLIELARDIGSFGLSPMDPLLVTKLEAYRSAKCERRVRVPIAANSGRSCVGASIRTPRSGPIESSLVLSVTRPAPTLRATTRGTLSSR